MCELQRKVFDELSKHLSSINARVIVDRAKRGLKDPTQIKPHERGEFLSAVCSAVTLFVTDHRRNEILSAIPKLAREANGAGGAAQSLREIEIRNEEDLRLVRLAARETCQQLGASSLGVQKVATVVSELARNIVRYTEGGKLRLETENGPPIRVTITAEDKGAGIPNLEEVLSGKYRSKTGLGRGLLGVKQMMETFEITTGANGTRIKVATTL